MKKEKRLSEIRKSSLHQEKTKRRRTGKRNTDLACSFHKKKNDAPPRKGGKPERWREEGKGGKLRVIAREKEKKKVRGLELMERGGGSDSAREGKKETPDYRGTRLNCRSRPEKKDRKKIIPKWTRHRGKRKKRRLRTRRKKKCAVRARGKRGEERKKKRKGIFGAPFHERGKKKRHPS